MQMMHNTHVVRLDSLPLDALRPLLDESLALDFEFVQRLQSEYLSGVNQFKQPGEALFAIYQGPRMLAIGGLNRDPYLADGLTGRVRHVYVLVAWRRQGIGKQLLLRIIQEARGYFRLLTLRTLKPQADMFYRALGFQKKPEIYGATHHLILKG